MKQAKTIKTRRRIADELLGRIQKRLPRGYCFMKKLDGAAVRLARDLSNLEDDPWDLYENYDWNWKNSKNVLLGDAGDNYSIFEIFYDMAAEFSPGEGATALGRNGVKWIDKFEGLGGCKSLEELAIKMDLAGI